MEEQLKRIWSQTLDCPLSDVDNESNFFESGGDSVMAINFVGLANKSGLRLDAQTIFEHPVFHELAERCKLLSQVKPTGQAPQNRERPLESSRIVKTCVLQCGVDSSMIEDILPCTPFQRSLMAASHESTCWLMDTVIELQKGTEERVRKAFEVLRQKNAILRTRIIQHGLDLYQVILNDCIEWHEEHTKLDDYMSRDLARRMCYGDPLGRYAIIRDAGRSFFMWTKAHAIDDRWTQVLFRDDLKAYFQDPTGFLAKPDRLPYSKFIDYISPLKTESITFWRKKLQGLPRYDLLFKPAYRNMLGKTGFYKPIKYTRLRDTTITHSTFLHVAWALTLANVAEHDDTFYCSFRSGRQMAMAGIETIAGPLTSIVPVRMRLRGDQNLAKLLHEVQSDNLAATPYEPFGLQAMQEHFGHNKFLQCVLVTEPFAKPSFNEIMPAGDDGAKSGFEDTPFGSLRCSYGFFVITVPDGDTLQVRTLSDRSFLEDTRVEQIINQFTEMLGRILNVTWQDTKIGEFCPHLKMTSSASSHSSNRPDVETTSASISRRLVQFRSHLDPPSSTSSHSSNRPDAEVTSAPCSRRLPIVAAGKDTLSNIISSVLADSQAIVLPEEPSRSISYEQLYKDVISLQQELRALGISKGSVVSIALPNSYEFIVSFLAITWQRAVAAPLNSDYKQEEFAFYLADAGTSLVLVSRGSYQKNGAAVLAGKAHGTTISECHWDGHKVIFDVQEGKNSSASEKHDTANADEDDVALLLHTSGTTGKPKAVPLTHFNLTRSTKNICATYALGPVDRTMLIMPLFHVHGLLASLLAPLYSGGTIVLPRRLDHSFWQHFVQHKATWYTATPTMHRIILQLPPPSPLPEIRFIRSCSSQLPPSLFDELEKRFRAPVLESYAMTEASHLVSSNPLPPGKRLAGCVGHAAEGVELAILDKDDRPVPQGTEGEVCIRGENVMSGYLENPAANESSFTQATNYFRTGDQGKLDEDGYLILTGRIKEFINKGGEKISPVELDNTIGQHEMVQEVVTFAIDDEMYGQNVACAIRTKEGANLDKNELKKWLRKKVAAQKLPREVFFVNEIPKTATGKVQRKMVAETLVHNES